MSISKVCTTIVNTKVSNELAFSWLQKMFAVLLIWLNSLFTTLQHLTFLCRTFSVVFLFSSGASVTFDNLSFVKFMGGWGRGAAVRAEKAFQQSFILLSSALPFIISKILRILLVCYAYFSCFWPFLKPNFLSRTHSDNSSIYVFMMYILLQCFYPV